jgi:hypothetical protein
MAHVQQPVQSGFSRIAEALSDPAREAIVAGPFPNAILERLIETRCVASLRISRALRSTEKGRAFFARLGAEVPF